jgi:hypothetical protein
MKTMLVCLVAVVSAAMLLGGCGGDTTSVALTAEQEKVAKDLKDKLDAARTTANTTIEAAKKSADADVQKAAATVEQALKAAQTAVADLRVQGTATFENKKAAAEKALQDLQTKATDLLAKSKLPIKLP